MTARLTSSEARLTTPDLSEHSAEHNEHSANHSEYSANYSEGSPEQSEHSPDYSESSADHSRHSPKYGTFYDRFTKHSIEPLLNLLRNVWLSSQLTLAFGVAGRTRAYVCIRVSVTLIIERQLG